MLQSKSLSLPIFGVISWLRMLLLWAFCLVGFQASVMWTGFWKGYEPIVPWNERWSASDKFELLTMKMDSADRVSPPFYDYASLLRNLGAFPIVPGVAMQKLMQRSTWRPKISDRKTLHTQGTYGRVRIEWTEEAKQFSGVFQDEISSRAILNYSNGFRLPQVSNFFGISLNIFRDGYAPASVLTAYNFFSVPNWNMFDYLHCNHYNWVYGLPLLPFSAGPAGQAWTSFFSMMGLSDLGTADGSGRLYNEVKTPFALCFRPTPHMQVMFEGFPPYKHPSELLQFVPPDSHLYELFAVTSPEALLYTDRERFMDYVVKVGDIHLQSDFNRCEWCDAVMWVRHTRMEEDLAYNPSWTPIVTNLKYLVRTGSVGLYQHIMPTVHEDQANYQVSLTKYSDQVLRFLSTEDNFVELLRQFGVTPKQLYREQIERSLDAIKQSFARGINFHGNFDETGFPYVGSMMKVSPRWVYRLTQALGEPVVQYWKRLGLTKMNEVSAPLRAAIRQIFPKYTSQVPFDRAVDFSNMVIQNLNKHHNDPNVISRIKKLKNFIKTFSPLFSAVSDDLCANFDRALFFIDCDQAKEWLLDNACHASIMADVYVTDQVAVSEILAWRKDLCILDPPTYLNLSERIDIGTTLFDNSPVLMWPKVEDSYLLRLKDELKLFRPEPMMIEDNDD